ncbi:hypothetical protein ACIBG4_08375 [Nonomuraea sp. NPDC050383]|uniref:hypothetical protein n=1 Tax=Nonomuraea sp. NPDC050383 TaxID=3364362 RepID=UPI0037AAD1C0
MKVRGGRTLTLATVGALALSLLAVGGVATASSSGEVYACVNKKSRYARIVNASTPCRRTEIRMVIGGGTSTTTISEGTKGDTGAQGPKGDTGPQGPRGPQGLPGKNGVNGKDGKDGVNGKDGENGKDGLPGKDGKNGEDGKPGLPGKNGENGKDGKDGVDGKDGKPGKGGATYTSYTNDSSISGTSGSASCDNDDLLTGGGFSVNPSYTVLSSMPSGNAWSVSVVKEGRSAAGAQEMQSSGAGKAGTVYVVCLKKS